ncbi:MAG: PaaI family thioesterase [Dehalococcoidia bacterium]
MRKLPPYMRDAPFVDNLGVKFPRIEKDYCQARARVKENMLNNYGAVHGGAIYTMADACMGAAAFFALAEDELCKTIELKINYFRPVVEGKMVCEARVVNKSNNLSTVEGEVTNDGRLIAKALGTYFIQKIEPKTLNGGRDET